MKRIGIVLLLGMALNAVRALSGTVASIPITGFEDGVAPRIGGEGRQPESEIDLVGSPVHSGKKSARLHYVFRKDVKPRQYVELRLQQPVPGIAKSISAWLYGDGSKQVLKMRVTDAEGEIFQLRHGEIHWTGWRHIVFNLGADREVSWGGDHDGKMDMPIKGIAYLIDSPVEPFESDLYIDDVTYTAEGDRLDFVSVSTESVVLGNAFYGRPAVIRVTLTNVLPEPVKSIPISLRVLSPDDDAVICEQKKAVDLLPGIAFSLDLEPVLNAYGLYHGYVALGDSRQERFAFSYLPEADAQASDPSSSFGVSMHFGHGARGPIENNLRLASDMGIRWVRDDAAWSSVEREKGVYNVPPTFDRFLRTARNEWGCEPLIILDYSNTLYERERSVTTEAGRQAFANWAEYMARSYRGSVTYWEIWNEPNISGFWKPKPNPADYALLLKAAHDGVKRGNPDAVVVAMATAGIDYTFIESVLKEGTVGYFDAISVHPYRYPRSPDKPRSTVDSLQRLVDLLAENGAGGTPIYNTEVGWPNHTGPRGLPEQTSADYLARMYTALRSLPDVKATFWYDFQNDGRRRDYNENNFGLLHFDFTPKAPAVAYRMTSRALKGRNYLRELELGDQAKGYVFDGSGDDVLVAAWATDGTTAAALCFSGGEVRETRATGCVRDLACRDGVLVLELGSTPVFLTGQGPVEVGRTPLSVSATWAAPCTAATFSVAVNNPWRTPRTGRLDVTVPDGWVTSSPGVFSLSSKGTAGIPVTVEVPSTAETGTDHTVSFTWSDDSGKTVAVASTPIRVVAAANVSLCVERERANFAVRIRATTPLAIPPAIESIELALPDAWGGTRKLDGPDLHWKKIWWGKDDGSETPPARKKLSVTVPVPSDAAFTAPVPATVTVSLAGGAPITASRELGFWRIPSLSPAIDGDAVDWAAIPFVTAASFDGTKKEAWGGPGDCSLGAKLAWDRENL